MSRRCGWGERPCHHGPVADGLDAARVLLPGTRVVSLGLLGGSGRSSVRRVRADDRTLIVKEFIGAGAAEGWVRETAALSMLPAEVRAPRLVAAGADPPTVVMSDLGSGPSVADALLGRDPAEAADAVVAWATTIGVLHRATAGARAAFRDALGGTVAESTVPADLAQAADSLHDTLTGRWGAVSLPYAPAFDEPVPP